MRRLGFISLLVTFASTMLGGVPAHAQSHITSGNDTLWCEVESFDGNIRMLVWDHGDYAGQQRAAASCSYVISFGAHGASYQRKVADTVCSIETGPTNIHVGVNYTDAYTYQEARDICLAATYQDGNITYWFEGDYYLYPDGHRETV